MDCGKQTQCKIQGLVFLGLYSDTQNDKYEGRTL